MEQVAMRKPKYGPSLWSAPPALGVYKYVVLPLLLYMPLLGLWMQGHWTTLNATLSCLATFCVYAALPFTTALNRERYLREYWGYRNAIEARLRQPDISPAEKRYLLRRQDKLEAQYHLVLNPTPAMEFASNLAFVALRLARMIARL